jgi:Gas vesicle synthesis protein GvpL/GvpF
MPDYVYGIVGTGSPAPGGRGVLGAPVRLVANGETAALVSDLDRPELELGRDEVLTHARVLEEALGQGTVLPMRFGMVLDGDDEVRDRLLQQHADALRDQLRRFSGKVELGIRATYEEDALMREIVAGNPQIARLRNSIAGQPEDATYYQRIQLGEHVAAAIERLREVDSKNIVDALSQVAEAVVESPPVHERVALSAAFLVARDRLKEFDQVLEAFAEGQGGRLRFKYTGPLPPHSFVQFAEGT